jgi:hypothetical protein
MASKEMQSESLEETGILLDEERTKNFDFDTAKEEIPRSTGSYAPWLLVVLLSITLVASIGLNIKQYSDNQEALYSTYLPDAKQAVQYERRKYTGALVYDEETKRAIRVKDAPIEYFGPSSDVDAAWDELLRGKYSTKSSR